MFQTVVQEDGREWERGGETAESEEGDGRKGEKGEYGRGQTDKKGGRSEKRETLEKGETPVYLPLSYQRQSDPLQHVTVSIKGERHKEITQTIFWKRNKIRKVETELIEIGIFAIFYSFLIIWGMTQRPVCFKVDVGNFNNCRKRGTKCINSCFQFAYLMVMPAETIKISKTNMPLTVET